MDSKINSNYKPFNLSISKQFPKVGLRTIKSAISVFLCLLLFPDMPFFACLTAVICLQDTVSNSIEMGINRGLGTILGGLMGLIFLIFTRFISSSFPTDFISSILIYTIISIGIIAVIYCCNLINKTGAINIACIVFLGVTTAHAYEDPLHYALNRTIQTLFGILISILVNKYITPPKEKHPIN